MILTLTRGTTRAVLLLLALSLITPIYSDSPDTTTGLVGHWIFDEGTGTNAFDSSGNGHTGTVLNGANWTSGHSGYAVSVNPGSTTNQAVTLSSLPSLSSDLTISVWAKIDAHSSGSFLLKGSSIYRTGTEYGLTIATDRLEARRGGSYSSSPANTIILNSWHLYTVVFTSTRTSYYRDGLLLSTSGTLSGSATGSTSRTVGYAVKGSIDDVRLYDRALSATDVLALMHADPLPPPSPSSPDTTAPSAVITLSATHPTSSSIALNWTAPGDDENTGTAHSYDIRYSSGAIDESTWAHSTKVSGEPTPAAAGASQSIIVGNLSPATTYYFAITTSDEVANVSVLSNIAFTHTTSAHEMACSPVTPSPRAQANINTIQGLLPQYLIDAAFYRQSIEPYRTSQDPNIQLSVDAVDLSIQTLLSIPTTIDCDPEAFAYAILGPMVTRVRNALPYFYDKALRGVDPFEGMKSGVVALKSPIDSWIDFYYYSLPVSYNPSRQYRLNINLHAAHTCKWQAMGLAGTLIGDVSLSPGPNHPDEETITFAPCARHNISYSSMSEATLLQDLHHLMSRYSIDPDRITTRGASMGGSGSYRLAALYPDMFSAAGAITGTPFYGLPKNDYRYDPTMLTKNLLHVPFVTWNAPGDTATFANSEAFDANLTAHEQAHPGFYPHIKYTDPKGGHGVITSAMLTLGENYIQSFTRNSQPLTVSYVTGSEKYDGAYWVHGMARETSAPGEIVAQIDPASNTVTVTTTNLRAFALELEHPELVDQPTVSVVIDGRAAIIVDSNATTQFSKSPAWQISPTSVPFARMKKKGLSGPIPEIFTDKPVLAVYGTREAGDPVRGNTMVDRAIFTLLSRPQGNGMHHTMFERKADTDVTAADIQNKHLILVGTPAQNSIVAQISGQVPIQYLANGVRIRNVNYTGTDVRWSVIYPNPLNVENYVLLTNENQLVNSSVPLANIYKSDFLVYRPASPTSPYYTILGSGVFDQSWQ